MTELLINAKWMAASSGEPEVRATAAHIDIHVDRVCLTRNQDIWAETVRDSAFLSAYPLAMWLASSWWRLNYEPLPAQPPGYDWRSAHELGAANHGFVWPRVIFIPDGEAVQVWAGASMVPDQSVQYLQTLDVAKLIPLHNFQQSIQRFVQSVLARLDAKQLSETNLSKLWAALQEDQADPHAFRLRKLEAELGFDPEECPEDQLNAAMQWEARVGPLALSELAPAIASSGASPDLSILGQLANAEGIVGTPDVKPDSIQHLDDGAPWEQAVHDAQALRRRIGNVSDPMTSKCLHGLLGLSSDALANWSVPASRPPVAVAVPTVGDALKFVPRRRSPIGQRFELARFLGEYLRVSSDESQWLASSDLKTSRQKYQRAFAAELLCPIDSLTSFLNGDLSSDAIEEAAHHFEVSEQAVTSLLLNNGYLSRDWSEMLPYRTAA
ncbi:hypothetical protein OU995_24595 [Roseateles sp. SL47]|uniref:ImmA/IrrE family metallo-endopeptidase n=1 Tax=Roseateles sp. SL47 TaxID=2995138 RepID=UPI0022703DE4|nr:hypothetical protein [Roseateles sp. SL47]WAC72675.1 hypothetical protein OU995_24595 [Roseateles sp. SL47]